MTETAQCASHAIGKPLYELIVRALLGTGAEYATDVSCQVVKKALASPDRQLTHLAV